MQFYTRPSRVIIWSFSSNKIVSKRDQCTAWAAGCNQVVRWLSENSSTVNCRVTTMTKTEPPFIITPAVRNRCLRAAQCLVEELGPTRTLAPNMGSYPFNWLYRNCLQVFVSQWLVLSCGVNPVQVNAFECTAVHWLGIAPVARADTDDDDSTGSALLHLAEWLASVPETDCTMPHIWP
jgi:hypothetical protein